MNPSPLESRATFSIHLAIRQELPTACKEAVLRVTAYCSRRGVSSRLQLLQRQKLRQTSVICECTRPVTIKCVMLEHYSGIDAARTNMT